MKFEDFLDAEIKFSDSKRDCALKAWNHQQAKIDAVLKYLDTNSHPLDIDVDTIKELLK